MDNTIEEFAAFLRKKHTANYCPFITKKVQYYLTWRAAKAYDQHEHIDYAEVMDYIDYCHVQGNKINTIAQKIRCLKLWIDYLGQKPNPCSGWHLSHTHREVAHHLLDATTLHKLYYQYPQSNKYQIRDKVALGLLICQGLHGGHLRVITCADVHIDIGCIHIKSIGRSKARSLPIQDLQKPLLVAYLQSYRQQFANHDHAQLFCTDGEQNSLSSFTIDLYRRYRKLIPGFTSFYQIRASVITNWLRHYNLREVQYKAGHRYVSSTERYMPLQIESLRQQIDTKHPLLS